MNSTSFLHSLNPPSFLFSHLVCYYPESLLKCFADSPLERSHNKQVKAWLNQFELARYHGKIIEDKQVVAHRRAKNM